MNRVIRHIEHLLIAHDCVIVPGVGAILAHTLPARLDRNGAMLSPERVFTFNPALNHNDGIIAASIARAEGISYEAASVYLDSEVAEMRRCLDADSRLKLGRIGTLLRNADGSMRFVPASAAMLSPATMWLPKVNLAAFAAVEAEEERSFARAAAAKAKRPGIFSKVARMAAAVAVLVAVGLTLMTPVKMENPQYASLGFDRLRVEAPAPSLIETPGQATAPVVLVIERRADAETVVDTAAYASMREEARMRNRRSAVAKRYCLVVASLASESEARKFMDGCNDNTLGVFAKDGRYRVFAAEGNSPEEVAVAAAGNGASERYPQSWVCRR